MKLAEMTYEHLAADLRKQTSELFGDITDTNFPETGGLIDEDVLVAKLQALVLAAYKKGREDQVAIERSKATDDWCDAW